MITHRDKFVSPSLELFREACRQSADQAGTLRHGLSHNVSPSSSKAP